MGLNKVPKIALELHRVCGMDQSRPQLAQVHFEATFDEEGEDIQGRAVATDGTRLAVVEWPGESVEGDGQAFNVPAKAAKNAARLGDKGDVWAVGGIGIACNATSMVHGLQSDDFPDWMQIVPARTEGKSYSAKPIQCLDICLLADLWALLKAGGVPKTARQNPVTVRIQLGADVHDPVRIDYGHPDGNWTLTWVQMPVRQ